MQSTPLAAPGAAALTLPPSARPLAVGAGGAALFGLVLRTAVSDGLGLSHLGWALALPGVTLLAWALCLPALYILWAIRQPGLDVVACARASAEAVEMTGRGLASTAPILWFFAATAPESRVVSLLAFAFTGLALLAGASVFGQALRRGGAPYRGLVQTTFTLLFAITFAQCAHGAGLHWF